MRTGELVVDLSRHLDAYGYSHARALVEQKTRGERVTLSAEQKAQWTAEVERAFSLLDEAHVGSPLPETPPNAGELEAWLQAVRFSAAAR